MDCLTDSRCGNDDVALRRLLPPLPENMPAMIAFPRIRRRRPRRHPHLTAGCDTPEINEYANPAQGLWIHELREITNMQSVTTIPYSWY
jgi:hypothetical protein